MLRSSSDIGQLWPQGTAVRASARKKPWSAHFIMLVDGETVRATRLWLAAAAFDRKP
jgi:hypothetical protein